MMREIQDEIVSLLEADDYFADIGAIVTERKGNLLATIAQLEAVLTGNVDGKVGVAIIVVMASMLPNRMNVPGPQFDQVDFAVRVLENVEINIGTDGVGKSAEDVVEHVAALLHGQELTATGSAIYCRKPGIVPADDPLFTGYDVFFRGEGRLLYQPTQCIKPSMQSQYVIDSTAGSTIYIALDGTRPTPANYDQQGAAPLTIDGDVPLGTAFRARAYKTGLRASEISDQVVGAD